MIMKALVVLGVASSLLVVRTPFSPKLSIAVEPSALESSGDTVRVSYRVTSSEQSTSELLMFTVDAPSRALRVEIPANASKRDYDTGTEFGRSVASWGFMRSLIPGATSPALSFSAVGLPGIVKYWATPLVLPDTVETPDVPAKAGQPVGPGNSAADSGYTVGVVPFPSDRSRIALLARLDRLTRSACARAWVDNAGVCNSLLVKIRQGDDDALMHELDAQRGKHVNATAYFLLAGNVQALPKM